MVQEGQIPPDTKAILCSALNELATRNFGSAAEFHWIEVPRNSGFTAGKPSTSSLVSMQANRALDFDTRKAILTEMSKVWSETTGCSEFELLMSVRDPES